MSDLKPINFYNHAAGPNPKKVSLLFHELNIPYNDIVIANPKSESFLAINPNGRLPAIEDPNTGVNLWESGAIIEYLVETYDKENKLGPKTDAEKWQFKQYLHFQMSGQGPYFGQYFWFNHFHPEKIASAQDRYAEQTARVWGVLDKILEGKEYLIGNRFTAADLAFLPWNTIALKDSDGALAKKFDVETKYPNFFAWHKRLLERDSAKKVYSPAA